MKNYRQLNVWKNSHDITLVVYRLTNAFPKEELFGLTSQIRGAASSVPANLAEGCGRDGDAGLKRFANIARGSACELDYPIQLATDLGYVETTVGASLAEDIMHLRRMLGAFMQKLKARPLLGAYSLSPTA